MTHTGVVKTLFEMNLLPKVITGSSGGSIIAAAVCVYTDEELPKKLFSPENLHLVILQSMIYLLHCPNVSAKDVFETREEQGNLLHRLYRMLTHRTASDHANSD